MQTFYLGYLSHETPEITQFTSAEEADYEAEEWLKIEANTLSEAIAKYEVRWKEWKQEQARIHGDTNP